MEKPIKRCCESLFGSSWCLIFNEFWEDWWVGDRPLCYAFPHMYHLSDKLLHSVAFVLPSVNSLSISFIYLGFNRPLTDREAFYVATLILLIGWLFCKSGEEEYWLLVPSIPERFLFWSIFPLVICAPSSLWSFCFLLSLEGNDSQKRSNSLGDGFFMRKHSGSCSEAFFLCVGLAMVLFIIRHQELWIIFWVTEVPFAHLGVLLRLFG